MNNGLILWFVFCAAPLEVDQAEVLRLGNMVQHVGGGPRAAEADAYVEALAPPASDADKWFISVLTTQGCLACEGLKRDWASDPWLLALANPADPKQSWAHYNVYLRQDRSQAFRFEGIQVTGYPTVIVQPPRTGKYGDPKTVVFQGVYGGNPQQLAQRITAAIRQYVSKITSPSSGFPPPARHQDAAASGNADHIGIDPPWQPPPKEQPLVAPRPAPAAPLDRLLQIIPPQPAVPPFPWSAVLAILSAGLSLPTAIAVLVWTIYFLRARREASGKPPLIDPQTMDRVLEVLKAIAEASNASPPKRGTSQPEA